MWHMKVVSFSQCLSPNKIKSGDAGLTVAMAQTLVTLGPISMSLHISWAQYTHCTALTQLRLPEFAASIAKNVQEVFVHYR